MADQLVKAQGSQLHVSATLPDASGADNTLVVGDFDAVVSSLERVKFITSLGSPDSTRPADSTDTIDEGAAVSPGIEAKGSIDVTILAIKGGNNAAYKAIQAAYKAGSESMTCRITYSDKSVQWFIAHPTSAQQGVDLGGKKQMVVNFAVESDVFDVEAPTS